MSTTETEVATYFSHLCSWEVSQYETLLTKYNSKASPFPSCPESNYPPICPRSLKDTLQRASEHLQGQEEGRVWRQPYRESAGRSQSWQLGQLGHMTLGSKYLSVAPSCK
jgi:hypothetical protein